MRFTDKIMYFFGYELGIEPRYMPNACTILQDDSFFRLSIFFMYSVTIITLKVMRA